MPRARSTQYGKKPQHELDGSDVLEFLEKFPCVEFSRSDIARGSGVPDNHRIGPAICLARAAAEHRGARIESYSRSKNPARKGVPTLRYIPAGKGDADTANDANRSSRSAITRLEDARRACDFASKNRHIAASEEYGLVSDAFGACLSNVSSIQKLNEKLWQTNKKYLEAAARVAEYEAKERKSSGLSIVRDFP